MDKVQTVDEAEHWFLNNHDPDKFVLAINSKGEEKVCDCFTDAEVHLKS